MNKTINVPETTKKINWYVVGGVSLGVLALIAIAMAVILPIVKINSDFDNIFKDAKDIENSKIIVTDMMTENNFSNAAGEVVINDRSSVDTMIKRLSSIADGFKYDRRDSNTIGAWDIRFKITNGEETVIVYLADEKMYYESNNVKYIFVPENDDVMKEYGIFYKNICKMVK